MKTKEYRTVDKSSWPRGEWDNEPDKKQWIDAATGFPCLIVRNHAGALCGYVGVSEGHPLFEKEGDNGDVYLSCHGGVSFSDHCLPHGDDESVGICHTVEAGDDDNVWWIGFDCNHYGDAAPGGHRLFRDPMSCYRNFAYVTSECESLAKQLEAIGLMEATPCSPPSLGF